MCRMIGVVFRDKFPVDSLVDLRHVAEVGKLPDKDLHEEDGHRDGWGIVTFSNGSPRYIGRSPRPAHVDPSFDSASREVCSVSPPNILIAHVRASSRGGRKMENTHPFIRGGVALAHNGTVYDFDPQTRNRARGDTDSERILMLLADRYEETGDLGSSLRSTILDVVGGYRYSAVILLVSDGRTLCGFRSYARGKSAEYYNLKIARCRNHVILFQESFLGYDADVSEIENGELVEIDMDLNVVRERII